MLSIPIEIQTKDLIIIPEPPIDVVKQIIRSQSKQIIAFGSALKDAAKKINIPANIPLSYFINGNVACYPNIIVPMDVQLTGVCNTEMIKKLRDVFYGGISVTKFARKWENPDNFLKKKEEVAVARFIRKLIPGEQDNIIRDIAQRIEDFYKPASLIMPKTATDYYEMYDMNTYSCMRVGEYTHLTEKLCKALQEQRLWPSLWLAYCPDIQGVYIKKNNTTVARAFLFRNATKSDKWTAYSKARGVTEAFADTLDAELRKIADDKIIGRDIALYSTFEMPAYEINGEKYAPIIQLDNLVYDFGVYYSPSKDVFTFGPMKNMPKGTKVSLDGYSAKGFIAAKDVFNYDGVKN